MEINPAEYSALKAHGKRAWWLVDLFLETVSAWHNDTHTGAFMFCDAEPCHAINRDFVDVCAGLRDGMPKEASE